MPSFIIKLTEAGERPYLIWSTIVDAPVSWGMSREELEAFIRHEGGQRAIDELPARMARVEKTGSSSMDGQTEADVISGNRAGPNETHLSRKKLVQKYCIDRKE